MTSKRTSDEIKSGIEAERIAFSRAVGNLRHEISELTDWRKQISTHREQLIAGASAIGGVTAAIVLLKRLLSRD